MPEAVVIAIVTGVFTGIPATIAAIAAYRKAGIAEEHVRPNGQGSLPTMVERQLLLTGELRGTVGALKEMVEHHVENPNAHNQGS